MGFIRWLLGKIILILDGLFVPASSSRGPEAQRKIDSSLENLSLYEYRACPFCVKVRRFLKGQGASIRLVDAKAEPHRSELLKQGGKLQVPCLKIEKPDGSVQWMYESTDIVTYLKTVLPA